MELNKSTIKKIILLMIAAGAIVWCIINFASIGDAVSTVINLINPLIIGFFTAFILNVCVRGIENYLYRPLDKTNNRIWMAVRRALSVVLAFAFVTGIIVILITLILPEIKAAVILLIEQFPGYWENLQILLDNLSARFGFDPIKLPLLQIDWDKALKYAEQFLNSEMSGTVVNTAIGGIAAIVTNLFDIVVGLIFAIYMIYNKEKFGTQVKKLAYGHLPRKAADELVYIGRLSNKTFGKFVTGQCTEAIIIGALCFIGMTVFRMPYAPMISALVGFTALIPVFGAFIGTVIGAFLILMVEPIQALWFVIFIIILQQIEGHVIYPKVVGSSIGLPAIWTMLAVIVGGTVGGVLGMLIGVPMASVAYSLIRKYTNLRLEKKEIDVTDL